MSLDIYFPHNIARIIRAVAVAQLAAAAAHGGGNVEYCRGAMDMARAMALAFGLDADWREEER